MLVKIEFKVFYVEMFLSKKEIKIRTKFVLNTSGPWLKNVLRNHRQTSSEKYLAFSKAVNLVTKENFGKYALAFESRSADRTGKRLFFCNTLEKINRL